MSPRRTRRGTIRENISEICSDSSFKSSKTVRSTRRVNKSQIVKGSEEESDIPVELNSSLNNITTFLNGTSSTRKQKRKPQEVIINEDSTLSVTTEESKTKSRTRKKSLKTPKSTGKPKSNKSQIIDINLLISEDESDIMSQKDERQLCDVDNLISEDEDILEPISRKRLKPDSKAVSEQITPEKSEMETTDQIKPETEITPKSSPLNVSFTPHRSKKTPKRSPINLGSPKTHTHDSFNLLNVQRKLSNFDSPPSSEQSNNSLDKSNSINFGNHSFESTKKKSKSKSSKLDSKSSSSNKKSISPLLKVRPKFSKSPKIVFRTPKSKSSKSKKSSTKKNSSSKKLSISPTKSKKLSTSPTKSKKSLNPNTSLKSEKNSLITSSSKSKKKSISPLKSQKISKPILSAEELTKVENLPFISLLKSDSPMFDLALESTFSIKVDSLNTSAKTPKINLKMNSSNSSNSVSKKSKKSSSKTISPVKSKKSYTPLISKKMPKIILSTKKSKSVSPSKIKKSHNVSPSKSKKSSNTSSQKSERTSVKFSPKQSIDSNKLSKNSSISPRVILKKLSSPLLNNSRLSAKENQPTINLIPVDHVQLSAKYSPTSISDLKSSKSSENKQSVTKSAKSVKRKEGMVKSVTISSNSNKNTPNDAFDKKFLNLKPTNTSTPREKIKRPFSLASNQKKKSPKKLSSIQLNGSSTPKPKPIKKLSNQSTVKVDQPLLEDESEPSLNDSSLIPMSDVFDSDVSQNDNTYEINKNNLDKRKSLQDLNVSEKINQINNTFEISNDNSSVTKEKTVKDDTYDLEKSDLETKSNKKPLNGHGLNETEEPESKKNYRVHFANSTFDDQLPFNTINRVGTPGHVIQSKKTPILINKTRTPSNQSYINKVESRRLNSVSNVQTKTSENISVNKRRSNSLSDTTIKSRKSNHEAQIASVNRLSRPKPLISSEKKLDVKTPVTKKIPNFNEIHRKNFAKMESLIDLKKRVEKRHVTLNTATPNTKRIAVGKYQSRNNKAVPSDSTNGVYNKFGFKLRKNEAVNMVSSKQAGNIESREEKRQNARNVLKGVRMNRRFELQMKSRIKNS